MKKNLINNTILILLVSIFFQSCTTEAVSKDKKFAVISNTMPLLYNKGKGGHLINTKGILRAGQYGLGFFNKNRGEVGGAIVSIWYITRSPKNEENTIIEICGKHPDTPKEHLGYSNIKNKTSEEVDKLKAEWKRYHLKANEYGECKAQTYNKYIKPNLITEYFYAKSTKDYKIIYPKKPENHVSYQMIVYKGRVGDLTLEALTEEQKSNLDKLRVHECYKWERLHGIKQKACYDLPGKDSNLYYGLRSELKQIEKSNAKYQVYTEPLSDIRISPPVTWHEIEGIKIDKEIYDYLYYRCESGSKYCHLNDYEATLTKEQKEYVEKVKWDKDKKWTEKNKVSHHNPWK